MLKPLSRYGGRDTGMRGVRCDGMAGLETRVAFLEVGRTGRYFATPTRKSGNALEWVEDAVLEGGWPRRKRSPDAILMARWVKWNAGRHLYESAYYGTSDNAGQ
uniref:Uncharacterized protein n=1 Tax=Vespula pensylvanica TaxID=30213 RepID=A0A834KMA2_VESPE|nr:hypothetical protein H0235_014107 [Vespula pensylvanica]